VTAIGTVLKKVLEYLDSGNVQVQIIREDLERGYEMPRHFRTGEKLGVVELEQVFRDMIPVSGQKEDGLALGSNALKEMTDSIELQRAHRQFDHVDVVRLRGMRS
jgi:hypothetical protein